MADETDHDAVDVDTDYENGALSVTITFAYGGDREYPSETDVLDALVDDHPNVDSYGHDSGNRYWIHYTVHDDTPGRGALGNARSDVEQRIEADGWSINPDMIEPNSSVSTRDYDFVIGAEITDETE